MKLVLTKKTKMIQGQKGHLLDIKPDGSINVNAVISVGANTPVDIRPVDMVDLNPLTYTEIVKYIFPFNTKIKIQEVMVSLLGMSGHFVLEYYNGTDTEIIRQYWVGHPAPFTETFGSEIILDFSIGAYLRWIAKLNGVGQQGKGYAIINGYY